VDIHPYSDYGIVRFLLPNLQCAPYGQCLRFVQLVRSKTRKLFLDKPYVTKGAFIYPTIKLKIALAQINTHLGDPQANLEKHLAYAKRASDLGADLLIFPELSLTGYSLQDLASAVAHRPTSDDRIFQPLLKVSKKLDLVVGFVDEDTRHRFFIAAAYLSGGEVMHIHHKVYLPTYGLFDESRFFAWGDSIRAFDTRFGRVGIAICEDFWHASRRLICCGWMVPIC